MPPINSPRNSQNHQAPLPPTYLLVTQLWSELLGVTPIEPTDRFRDLGGTSLLGETLLHRLSRGLGRHLPVDLIVDDPTAVELAHRLQQTEHPGIRSRSSSVVVRESASAATLFAVAGAGASAYCFVPLSAALPESIGVHAFQPAGLTARQIPDLSVERAARRNVRALRRIQPDGPYYLAGHSYGGHIAAAMATLLTAHGAQVSHLYLLDTVARSRTNSVADMITSPRRPMPTLGQRLLTHARVYGAGLVQFKDFQRHQALMWEQAIRVQNRHRTQSLADYTTVFVTDELADQESSWRELAQDPDRQVIRIPGSHVGAINDPAALEPISARIVTDIASRTLPHQSAL